VNRLRGRQTLAELESLPVLLGAHVSIAGGLPNAPYNGLKATCDVVQIFTKSSSQWREKRCTPTEVRAFRGAQQETGVRVVAAHDSYLINLASPDRKLFRKSLRALAEEVRRCEMLQIPCIVLHPGCHVGSGETEGLRRVAEALNRLVEARPGASVKFCIENTAGQGTSLGYRFEHLAEVIDRVESQERVAVCLDTCHLFAAGYRFRTRREYGAMFGEFDSVVGMEYLALLHLNDSKGKWGQRIDRHESIGRGEIGLEPFRSFLRDRRLSSVPMIIETPKSSPAEDILNLRRLRSLIRRRK